MNFAIPLITNDSKATASVLYCVLCESLFLKFQRKMSVPPETIGPMMRMLDIRSIRAMVWVFKCLTKKEVLGETEFNDMILPWLKAMLKPTKLLVFSSNQDPEFPIFKVVAFAGMNKYFFLGYKSEMSLEWVPIPFVKGTLYGTLPRKNLALIRGWGPFMSLGKEFYCMGCPLSHLENYQVTFGNFDRILSLLKKTDLS